MRKMTPILMACATLLVACSATPRRPIAQHPSVDLPRFMGPWYVIANIPTFVEKDAWNAVESYAIDPDGSIATTFTFRKGGFDGPEKRHTPRGFVRPGTNNAVWGMQFIWPIKAEYVISWVDPAYSETIIARSSLDYVWIMARVPELSAERYAALVERVRALGYDTSKLNKVPQRWPAK